MSGQKDDRNFRPRFAKGSSKMGASVADTFEVTESFTAALRRHFGHGYGAAKKLSADCEMNVATARNLLEGRNAPSASHLIRLMAECDEVFEEVCRMAGRVSAADADAIARDLDAIEAALKRARGG